MIRKLLIELTVKTTGKITNEEVMKELNNNTLGSKGEPGCGSYGGDNSWECQGGKLIKEMK